MHTKYVFHMVSPTEKLFFPRHAALIFKGGAIINHNSIGKTLRRHNLVAMNQINTLYLWFVLEEHVYILMMVAKKKKKKWDFFQRP